MTNVPDTKTAVGGPVQRERTVWRALVTAQLAVLALILVAIVVIFLMGAVGSLFAQHSL